MQLIDIDEFPNYCQEANSREMIREAVNAYKAGAYRATITYTWLGVILNITAKIEQLSILGDPEAIKLKQSIDKIKKDNNISAMLKFERSILEDVSSKFELFDNIVLVDLKRIQEDRNRCVHPLLHSDDIPFNPTAELAKTHLKTAIIKLLSEDNVFGKFALDKLVELINSNVFPIHTRQIERVLDGSYLARPKTSLINNTLTVMIKELLKEDLDFRKEAIRKGVIKYLLTKHRSASEKHIVNKFPDLCNFVSEKELGKLEQLLNLDMVFWDSVPSGKKILVKKFVRSLPESQFPNIESWLGIESLKEEAKSRISTSQRSEIINFVNESFLPIIPDEIYERAVFLYLRSSTFDEANKMASTIATLIKFEFDSEKAENLIQGIGQNSQVLESWQLPTVISSIKQSGVIESVRLNELFNNNNLTSFIETDDSQE